MADEVAPTKSARTAAKRIFNRNAKKISDSIEAEDSPSLIEIRFEDLKRMWNDVQEKHEKYIAALEESKTPYEAETEDKWIDDLDEVYENALRKKFVYLKVIEDAQCQTEMQQKKISEEQEKQLRKERADRAIAQGEQSRKVKETAFMQEVKNLKSMLALEAEKSSPAIAMLETVQNELKKQLEQCKKIHGEYVVLLQPERAMLEIAWITNLQKTYSQIAQIIGEIIQRKTDVDRESKKGNRLMFNAKRKCNKRKFLKSKKSNFERKGLIEPLNKVSNHGK